VPAADANVRRELLGRWIERNCPPRAPVWAWVATEHAYELWRRTHSTPHAYTEHWAYTYLDGGR
jgi:hypothetical protein